jgi:hypothetical protein
MLRLHAGAVLGWIIVMAIHTSAQQPRILPGTRPEAFSAVRGRALTSTDDPLPNAVVRLRDVRFGRSVGVQTTDESGLFAFRLVDPGNYVVEILGRDEVSVLAASQVVNVEAGESASTVVRLPFRASRPATAAVVAAQAALAGVLAAGISGVATCDTLR